MIPITSTKNKLIRGIHKEIYNYDESAFFNIVKDLLFLEIINNNIVETITKIMDLRRESLRNIVNNNIDEMTSIERKLNILKPVILVSYTYYVLKEFLDQERFTIELGKTFEFGEVDIFVGSNDITSKYKQVLIDAKIGQFSEQHVITFVHRLRSQLKRLTGYFAVPTKFVFIYFTPSPDSKVKTLLEDGVFNFGIQSYISIHFICDKHV